MATVTDGPQAAVHPPDLVEISRRLDTRSVHGFLIGRSEQLLLLHLLSDRLDLDGYTVFLNRDVHGMVRDFGRKAFYLRALKLKGCRAVLPSGIDLSSVPSLLRSVEANYPLVVIHRERIAPRECEIGRLKLTTEATYALRVITPEATWENDDRIYRYEDITRVEFDGEYENTLAMVASAG